MRRSLLLTFLLLTAACSDDPADPCGKQNCGAADLAITQFTVLGRSATDTIFSGDTLRFRVTVQNRGEALTDSSLVTVTLQDVWEYASVRIAPMAALSQRDFELSMVVPKLATDPKPVGKLEAEVMTYEWVYDPVTQNSTLPKDADSTNNSVMLTRPAAFTTARVQGPSEVRVLEPATFQLTIENRSPRAIPADSMQWCFWDIDTCFSNRILWLQVPAVPARSTITIPITITLPFADRYEYVWAPWGEFPIRVCYRRSAGDNVPVLGLLCAQSEKVTLVPNFAKTCPPRVVQVGVTVIGNTLSDCAPLNRLYSVWSFHAEAGERFEVIQLGQNTVGIVDERGWPDVEFATTVSRVLTAPRSGTYYVQAIRGAYSFRLERR